MKGSSSTSSTNIANTTTVQAETLSLATDLKGTHTLAHIQPPPKSLFFNNKSLGNLSLPLSNCHNISGLK